MSTFLFVFFFKAQDHGNIKNENQIHEAQKRKIF